MTRYLASTVFVALALSAPAHASAADRPVTFCATQPDGSCLDYATVHTDGKWRHWKRWAVETSTLDRSERCKARLDASRVLRDKPLTQGIPRRCDFYGREPDPAP